VSRIKSEDKIRGQNSPSFLWMVKKIALSSLTKEDATQLNLQPYTAEESVQLNLQRHGAGFKIPYYSADGKMLKMFRYRYEITAHESGFLKGAKLRKYDQPANTDPEVYLPQLKGLNWVTIQNSTDVPLTITEGELKAACACKQGLATVGVGGVYSFARKARHQHLLPELQAFKWKSRRVNICYDSDAITNSKVLIAENRLARTLTDEGAAVYIIRLPQNPNGEKVGLDDYIVANGVQVFQHLLDTTEPWALVEPLHKINSLAVYVVNPSMAITLPEEENEEFITYSVSTFVNEVMADYSIAVQNAKGDIVKKSAAAEWIKWPQRNKVRAICYEPGEPSIYKRMLNTWRGWQIEPVKGDTAIFMQLIKYIFQRNPQDMHWFMQWLAYPLQHPGTKLKQAVVMWSAEQGTGKSILGYTIGRIYGRNFSEVNKPDLAGNFNGWAVNKQFIMGEEITGGSGRDVADVLKNMITGTEVQVNVKYKPTYFVRNCINYYFTSNHQDAFFINDKDRRYFVQEVPGILPAEFWQTYDKWYKSDIGIAALFDTLLRYDLTGFDPQAHAPKTLSRQVMIEAGASEQQAWVSELKQYPDNLLRVGASVLKYRLYTTQDLMSLYAPEGSDRRNKSERALSIALKNTGFKLTNKGEAIDVGNGVRKRAWCVRDNKDAEMLVSEASSQYQNERKITGKGKAKYA
jgi:hypothetical protein